MKHVMYVKLLLLTVLVLGTCAEDDFDGFIQSVWRNVKDRKNKKPPDIDAIISTNSNESKDNVNSIFNTTAWIPNTGSHSDQSTLCGFGKLCVRKYLCSSGHERTDGATLIKVRIGIDDSNPCPFFEVCCSAENTVTTSMVTPPKTPSKCGYRNKNGIGFQIEGGTNEAEFGEFPWMLAILRDEFDENGKIHCGGSLIHPKVVLTGAHCVYGQSASSFKVRAGEWEIISKNEPYPEQDRRVADMVLHEHYNDANLHNDIALLFLETAFDLGPHINTLCLPPFGYHFDFSRCYAMGWGKTQVHSQTYQNILKKIDLPTVPNYVCQENLRKTLLGKHFQLDRSFVCAGGEPGRDTCEGDGGSPLVCPIPKSENRYYQAGTVAWGIGCGEEDVPGVYGNVAQFRLWIDEKFAERNLDSSHYIE